MSMSDALRGLKEKTLDWMNPTSAINEPPVIPTALESFAELVRMAAYEGVIDRHSATWLAVQAWCANELLETLVALEQAEPENKAALSERARTLRDMLAMPDKDDGAVIFSNDAPLIP